MSKTLEEKKQNLLKFKGVMAAVLTPYDQNGEVDVSQIPRFVKFLVENKVDGLYISGTTGEGFNLTYSERLAIAKAYRQAIDEQKANLLSVVNISFNCVKEAVELSKQVESLGFDGIAILPPNYYKPNSIKEWVSYLKVFGESAPNTPILYYHNTFRIGEFNFDIIEAIGEGLKQIPQLSAMKFSDTNAIRFSILRKRFKDILNVMVGVDEMLLTGLGGVGSKAGICGLFNLPEVIDSYKKMIKFVEQSDLESALKEQNKILELKQDLASKGPYLHSLKVKFNSEVKSIGLNFGVPRPPIYYHYKW